MTTSTGSILRGAFGLLRQHPLAALIWGLIYLGGVVALALSLLPMMSSFTPPPPGSNAAPDLAAAGKVFGVSLLTGVAFLFLFAILSAAATRAVLRPSQSSLAFLRIGMDEVRLFLLGLIFTILFYFLLIFLAIAATLIVILLSAAMGPAALPALAAATVIISVAVMAWLTTRLSLSYPLTILRREFVVFESWSLTKGRFWSLFGAYFVIFLLWFLLALAFSAVTSGSYILEMIRGGFSDEAMRSAMEHQRADQLAGITPRIILSWILSALAGSLGIALFAGASATATRAITTDVEGVAETFA